MSLDDLDGEHRDHLRYRWLVNNGYFRCVSVYMDSQHAWAGAGRSIPAKAPTLDEAIDQCIDNEERTSD